MDVTSRCCGQCTHLKDRYFDSGEQWGSCYHSVDEPGYSRGMHVLDVCPLFEQDETEVRFDAWMDRISPQPAAEPRGRHPKRDFPPPHFLPHYLYVYVVYQRPRDFPDYYVLRRWWVDDGPPFCDPLPLCVSLDLDEVRRQIPGGLVKLERSPLDDDAIFEVWI